MIRRAINRNFPFAVAYGPLEFGDMDLPVKDNKQMESGFVSTLLLDP